MDLVIRGATLPERDGLYDIAIKDGRITSISSRWDEQVSEELDAAGNLLSAGFIDAHVHLDKNLIGEDIPFVPTDSLAKRIEVARKAQWELARQPVRQRALNMVRLALSRGTTALRTHVDIDPVVGLKNLEAILEVRELCRGLMDIQIVAFPQSGILRAPGTTILLQQALDKGADVVGGIDPGGFDGNIQEHLDIVFNLAREFDVDVDIHLHDPGHLGTFTLQSIASKTTTTGYEGRVVVGHAFCLGEVPEEEAVRTIEQLQEAEVSIISAPQSNRTLPPIPKLLQAGVNAICASDNVRDAWSPFGNADMLERALLASYRFNLRTKEELTNAYRMIADNPARALRMETRYGLAVGKVADLVLLETTSPTEAIITQARRLVVIKDGNVVVKDGQIIK